METVQDYPRGVTFEQVWAALQRTQAIVEENALRSKELDRRMAETDRQIKETDLQIKETDRQIKETDRQIKEYNKRFGEFTNRFGEVVEYMVAPNLRERFRDLGLVFREVSNDWYVEDEKGNVILETDVMLQNGDKAMLVEVKTKPGLGDVKEHIKRLEKMRRYADLHGDRRKFLGAVAGAVLMKNVKQRILEQGLFAVEPSGETFVISAPQGRPREW